MIKRGPYEDGMKTQWKSMPGRRNWNCKGSVVGRKKKKMSMAGLAVK